uniref:Uncharacterized protein n=1 Tax=Pipistrellus kuhlii TaxID=59472 RepID=A0A7J7RMZ0_PIPKU|nr:hypothetical protein mPipKuh1_010389 [Pipistrellus kuhlii]
MELKLNQKPPGHRILSLSLTTKEPLQCFAYWVSARGGGGHQGENRPLGCSVFVKMQQHPLQTKARHTHSRPQIKHASQVLQPKWTSQSTLNTLQTCFSHAVTGERGRMGRGSCPATGGKATREGLGDSEVVHFRALAHQHPLQ